MATVIDLEDLGSRGAIIEGIGYDDTVGRSVSSAGDVNGDGFADVIIGAPVSSQTRYHAGEAYVIYGKRGGIDPVLDLAKLTPDQGYAIHGGHQEDVIGYSVGGGGDVNGDGFSDMLVSLPRVGDRRGYTGGLYVVFGGAEDRGPLDLKNFGPEDGFFIKGTGERVFGRSVGLATADINGDGFADVVFTQSRAGGAYAGTTFVIYGKSDGFGTIDVRNLSPADGFAITGQKSDESGASVASAGDVNGDGIDDLIIGAPGHFYRYGQIGGAYVVYGKTGGWGTVDLATLTPADGFLIQGITYDSGTGFGVGSAGDFNGDGYADVIINVARGNFELDVLKPEAGYAIVYFGSRYGLRSNVATSVNPRCYGFGTTDEICEPLINYLPSNDSYENTYVSNAAAGDINGDGLPDVVIGGFGRNHPSGQAYSSGVFYVLY